MSSKLLKNIQETLKKILLYSTSKDPRFLGGVKQLKISIRKTMLGKMWGNPRLIVPLL